MTSRCVNHIYTLPPKLLSVIKTQIRFDFRVLASILIGKELIGILKSVQGPSLIKTSTGARLHNGHWNVYYSDPIVFFLVSPLIYKHLLISFMFNAITCNNWVKKKSKTKILIKIQSRFGMYCMSEVIYSPPLIWSEILSFDVRYIVFSSVLVVFFSLCNCFSLSSYLFSHIHLVA